MIVDASRQFACGHRYIATEDGELVLLVCEHCGRRTELLTLEPARLPRRIIAFPFTPSSAFSSETVAGVSDLHRVHER
jgi:hypothetical protein